MMKPHEIPSKTHAAGMHIGIVLARFNTNIGEGLLKGALRFLREKGVIDAHVTLIRVPGALEIPLALQGLAQTGRFHALIALGAVIRGETYHFEIVSNESARGISEVALDFDIAIGNGVLTCDTDEQALTRMDQKGYEAALTAVEMANTLESLRKNVE
ncbi:MAG: 6,7-dimethyl-8-ribityllumazine synthase [Betaproteobacteria bacterium]|nr:6,7-dimethyl-8-ribityllumazine synthase [Betaproteobacteria bacterium]